MNYGLIAIYDHDSEYANCLANYFRIKGCLSGEIVVFTRNTAFLDYIQDHSIDILLINQELLNTVANITLTRNLFVLCEQKNFSCEDVRCFIYKYTSAEDILRQTMAFYEPDELYPAISFQGKQLSNIIGVYSPLNRCGKTSFSLALAIQYGMRSSCLFISMDEASTLRYLFPSDSTYKSLDDLLYYFLQSPKVFESKLVSIVKPIWGIDVVPPFGSLAMFTQLSIADWSRFIQALSDMGKYQYIVIDFGTVSPVQLLLSACKQVYMPTIEGDAYAADKIANFMECFHRTDSDENTPIQNISLPYIAYHRQVNDYLRELTSGDMGQFASDIATKYDV